MTLLRKNSRLYSLKAPLKNPRSKRSTSVAPWLTSGVLKSIKSSTTFGRSTKKEPNKAKLEAFKLYRNFLKSIIRRAKTVYFTKRFVDCGKNIKRRGT